MIRKVAVLYRNPAKVGPYLDAVRLPDLEPVPVAPVRGGKVDVSGYAGVVLTGGTDVDPALYGQLRHSETQEADRERDEFESTLLRAAVSRDLPVLAICRGMQLLNVVYGGSLIQHLPESGVPHRLLAWPEDGPGRHGIAHNVEFGPHGLLANVYGPGVQGVNSRHHQAVDRVGQGLVVVGLAADGVVEACEMPARRFVIGVQWHPEDRVLVSDADRGLFEAFARAVRRS